MSAPIWTLFCVLSGQFLVPGSALDCPYKECYCGGITISCFNRKFNSIPAIVSNNTAGLPRLMFDLNNITDIPAGHLPANLTDISWDHNPITYIDDNAFIQSADTLESLTFWGARFSKLPDALSQLKALKYLGLYDSVIADWNVNVMKTIGLTLESLAVKNAGVLSSPSWIEYLSSLQELTLDSCSVTSLPDNALDNVVDNITFISLLNNSLTDVPKALANLRVLKHLQLGHNQISDISWLPGSQFTSLNLDNNNISDVQFLSTILQSSSDSMYSLTLHVNQLTSIPDLDFLANLKQLDLTYNKISNPNSGSLPADMFALNLGNNLLTSIPKALANLTRLLDLILTSNLVREITAKDFPSGIIWVHLGHNLITELIDTTFPRNSSITYLHLNNNPINHVSSNTFQHLHDLYLVNLAETQITRVPLALTSVPTLHVFDATNCTELVCTCEEKSVAPVFTHLLRMNIKGNCGDTGIYDFFANYSSDC